MYSAGICKLGKAEKLHCLMLEIPRLQYLGTPGLYCKLNINLDQITNLMYVYARTVQIKSLSQHRYI